MTAAPTGTARLAELRANLHEVRARIEAAAEAANRPSDAVTLIAVTKTWPASDVRLLAALGVADVGENRDQEAAPKAAALADLPLRWHFVGQLQTNKAASVAAYADVVHSVDRPRLADALGKAATHRGRTLTALVQIDLSGERDVGRGGAAPDDVRRLAEHVAATPGLVLGGVMAVAPLDADPDAAFARLAAVAERLRSDHPAALIVSAGMSGDLEAAIRHGATHVRVGTALLGRRPPPVR